MTDFLVKAVVIFLGVLVLIPIISYEIQSIIAFHYKTKLGILLAALKDIPTITEKLKEIVAEKTQQ